MRPKQILRRLDAHIERGTEIMARSNELMEENRAAVQESQQAFQENRAAFQESRQAFQDLRVFLRELTRRSELTFEHMFRELAAQREASERRDQELIDEMRAQRQALFTILDRLDGKGGAATA
jgi:hypothetical protein